MLRLVFPPRRGVTEWYQSLWLCFSPTRKKSRWGTVFPIGLKRYKEPLMEPDRIVDRLLDARNRVGPAEWGDSCEVCHKKVVRISLEGDEILWVQGERTQGVTKTLLNTKVAKSLNRLAPSEMQELPEQLQNLQDKVLGLPRKEKLYAKFTKSEAVKNWEVPTTPSEM
ncbi:hypothetical protein Tco_1081385 [Tanacetum coccineum]|uniref:Uncharacterized protein n=1 Tax=Tanacetum coccineum TaxID=301880 RepID=A0ABQ5HXU3_9ASTR